MQFYFSIFFNFVSKINTLWSFSDEKQFLGLIGDDPIDSVVLSIALYYFYSSFYRSFDIIEIASYGKVVGSL